jgi:magnesium chelatase family protein
LEIIFRFWLNGRKSRHQFQINREARGESSAAVRHRVEACRAVQEARYAGRLSRTNGIVRSSTAELLRGLTPEAAAFLARAAERLSLSGRAIGKTCRVARTIADLAAERRAGLPHVAEALQYRLSGFGGPYSRSAMSQNTFSM